jgi:heme exporter protein C
MRVLKILNPNIFIKFFKIIRVPLILITLLTYILGLYLSLFSSPEDYQQGIMVRVMYIHVPSAWMSLFIFTLIGSLSISNLVWSTSFSFLIAKSSAYIGVCFSFLTLITGMLWGRPIWGTWWVWDARLTSMFILFIFYIIYIAISSSSDNISKIQKPASVIGVIGLINVPIVKFSVNIWYSLHQGPSIIRLGGNAMDQKMLIPLLVMFLANFLLFLILMSARVEIMYRNLNDK